MRANEFIVEVNEMAGEIHGGVRKELMDKGYKYLGSGIDKQAWLEPESGQVLIIFGYRKGIDDFSPDQRMFIDWINYCNQHKNNIHLPKFSGFESFTFQGKNYIQARMETLSELSATAKVIVSYLDILDDLVEVNDFDTALQKLAKHVDDNKVETVIKILGGKEATENLLKTVYEVKQFGKQHGFIIDLHSGNYMQRPNGTIVVNDPFVLWLKSK